MAVDMSLLTWTDQREAAKAEAKCKAEKAYIELDVTKFQRTTVQEALEESRYDQKIERYQKNTKLLEDMASRNPRIDKDATQKTLDDKVTEWCDFEVIYFESPKPEKVPGQA